MQATRIRNEIQALLCTQKTEGRVHESSLHFERRALRFREDLQRASPRDGVAERSSRHGSPHLSHGGCGYRSHPGTKHATRLLQHRAHAEDRYRKGRPGQALWHLLRGAGDQCAATLGGGRGEHHESVGAMDHRVGKNPGLLACAPEKPLRLTSPPTFRSVRDAVDRALCKRSLHVDPGGGPRRDVLNGDVMRRMAVGKTVENGGTPGIPDPAPVLGLRENLAQFSLLVLVTAFVGGMVGQGGAILPLIAERGFGLVSKSVILSFIVGFW